MNTHRADQTARVHLILAMVIFGTIGIFRKYLPLPSGVIAMLRGFIGMGFLLAFMKIKKQALSRSAIKNNLKLLIISGALIGFNWIMLFEAYQYTTVATATLCYYMAPVFVLLLSPLVLKERFTLKKATCILVACIGMVMVSGVLDGNEAGSQEMMGILLGLGAAVLYASVVMINQRIKEIAAYDKTIVQLGMAALVLVPYVMMVEGPTLMNASVTPLAIVMMLVVGILHTGVAYAMYFGAMGSLKAQTVALFSYIDPIVAVVLSALLLKENVSIFGWIGAVLILGATFISERAPRIDRKK
ncbi:MAG: EamA/RhaT family transporter [Clostridiales bacterium]|nr:EamA/RhaT family transporter [Clostridiales bacterium]